jgi:hypothetical protein
LLFEFRFAAAAKHEEVAAEEKVVAELLHLDLCASNGFAARIPHDDNPVALTVPLNARPGLGKDFLVGRFGFLFRGAPGGVAEQQGGGGRPGFEECSAIHGDSKQQAGALLKPKILLSRPDFQRLGQTAGVGEGLGG